MNNNIVLIGIGALILIGIGAWAFTSGGNQPQSMQQPEASVPEAHTFEVAIANRTLTPNIVTVTQGDQVRMKVTTDETGEFHVSGYEIENDMEAGKTLEFSFTADKAGRYNFELHPKSGEGEEQNAATESEDAAAAEDIVIGAFVVNPR